MSGGKSILKGRRSMSASEIPSVSEAATTDKATEQAVVGALFELNSDDCPPYLDLLLRHAPESFCDQRAGLTAEAIRKCRDANQPVCADIIADKLTFKDSTQYVALCLQTSLTPSAAEFYAKDIWECYQSRQQAQLLSEAQQQLLEHPEHGPAIREHIKIGLDALDPEQQQVSRRLEERKYSPINKPPEPKQLYFVDDVCVSTEGNLTSLSGQSKAGKTAVIEAMIAAPFAKPDADCLGFKSSNPDKHAVIHIDTEQSLADRWELIKRAERRAGVEAAPDWVLSYCLTGWKPDEIQQAIRLILRQAKKNFGGVHSLLLDGSGDAVHDVNDPKESNAFVAELRDLAIRYRCTFVTTIHLNPASESKTRGHLGSELERKSETNLRLEKQDEVITLFADRNRHAPIPKSTGPRFAWNSEAFMHTRVESRQQSKEQLERDELNDCMANIFKDRPSMHYSDLLFAVKTTVKKDVTVSDKTAERKITKAVTFGIIKKAFTGLYEYKG
jgi:hypothetical protein